MSLAGGHLRTLAQTTVSAGEPQRSGPPDVQLLEAASLPMHRCNADSRSAGLRRAAGAREAIFDVDHSHATAVGNALSCKSVVFDRDPPRVFGPRTGECGERRSDAGRPSVEARSAATINSKAGRSPHRTAKAWS